MNKLLALLAVAIVVVALMLQPSCIVTALAHCDILEITIYCNSCSEGELYNGIVYEVPATPSNYSSIVAQCYDIVGYSVLIDGSSCTLCQLCNCLLLCNIIECGQYSNCLYGYSPQLGSGIIIEGHRINVHIVKTAEGYMVGTPILLGSY